MLVLCMIVKNESRGIVRTLESVRGHVDAWCIVDTGSTDRTRELILETMAGVPGKLHEFPFVDFSTTRNAALALAEAIAPDPRDVWCFMISGDAFVVAPEQLRELVATAQEHDNIAASVLVRGNGLEYSQVMLTRGGSDCRFNGVTHEAMAVPNWRIEPAPRDLHVRYEAPDTDRRARWMLDRDLLGKELEGLTAEQRSERTRTIFYLAQSYECLGEYARAIELYTERTHLRGFFGERFISYLRVARCLRRTGAEPVRIVAAYLAAAGFCPDRAEPLADLADYYKGLNRWGDAHLMAARAAAMPWPVGEPLFLEPEIYDWRAKDALCVAAYWCARYQESADVARALLQSPKLPASQRARVEENLRWAVGKLK